MPRPRCTGPASSSALPPRALAAPRASLPPLSANAGPCFSCMHHTRAPLQLRRRALAPSPTARPHMSAPSSPTPRASPAPTHRSHSPARSPFPAKSGPLVSRCRILTLTLAMAQPESLPSRARSSVPPFPRRTTAAPDPRRGFRRTFPYRACTPRPCRCPISRIPGLLQTLPRHPTAAAA